MKLSLNFVKDYVDLDENLTVEEIAEAMTKAGSEYDSAEKLAVICDSSKLFDFISISDKIGIYEIQPKKAWIGKALGDLDIRNKFHINIVAIKIDEDVDIPSADYVFTGQEHLFVIGSQSNILKLTK